MGRKERSENEREKRRIGILLMSTIVMNRLLTLVASLIMLSQAWFGNDMYFSISLSITTGSWKIEYITTFIFTKLLDLSPN